MAQKKIQILPIILFTLGVYFIYKKVKSSGVMPSSDREIQTKLENIGVSKYIVDTKSGNLNVRNQPTATSPVQRQIKKGETFFGKLSADTKWIAIIEPTQLTKVMGYVSAQFVKKM